MSLVSGRALAMALAARASDTIPPPRPIRPMLITAALPHTVRGPVLTDGRMLIGRGRIMAITSAGEALPQLRGGAAEVLDLGGRHGHLGVIAADSAFGLTDIRAVRAMMDHAEAGPVNPNAGALAAVDAGSGLLPVTCASGVLAALVVPGSGQRGLIAGTSALMQLGGWNREERHEPSELPGCSTPRLKATGRQAAAASARAQGAPEVQAAASRP
jgi:hypothetical protein